MRRCQTTRRHIPGDRTLFTYIAVKGADIPVHSMKAKGGRGGTDPRILNLDTARKWPLYNRCQMNGRLGGP